MQRFRSVHSICKDREYLIPFLNYYTITGRHLQPRLIFIYSLHPVKLPLARIARIGTVQCTLQPNSSAFMSHKEISHRFSPRCHAHSCGYILLKLFKRDFGGCNSQAAWSSDGGTTRLTPVRSTLQTRFVQYARCLC